MSLNKIQIIKSKIEKTLHDNKAAEVKIIDLRNKTSIADFMIIASGTSSKHIQALSEMVLIQLKKNGVKNSYLEGKSSSEWKLVDGIDIIVHIFHPNKRKFYDLEKMWSEMVPKERLII